MCHLMTAHPEPLVIATAQQGSFTVKEDPTPQQEVESVDKSSFALTFLFDIASETSVLLTLHCP